MFFRILAIALCFSLVAPIGRAMERSGHLASLGRDDGLNRTSATAPSPNTVSPNRPQLLTPEEAQALSERLEEPGPEVAGGALSNLHLTYIVIALAAAVLVLILK